MIRPAMLKPISLPDRLMDCAAIWVRANSATLARLGRLVVNDGGFFTRIEQPSASTTTATLERFARFLTDRANWPEGGVPDEVRAFAHVVGITPYPADGSTPVPAAESGSPEPGSGRTPVALDVPPSAAGVSVHGDDPVAHGAGHSPGCTAASPGKAEALSHDNQGERA